MAAHMRIAIFSDIHGNSIALEAVLADIEAQGGVDGYWALGDLVAIGHDPITVLERLSALPQARFIRGNTDRFVVTGELPRPTLAEAKAKPNLLGTLLEVARSFAWTQGAVATAGWLAWLAALPLELRLELPDGTRFLGVHAAPGNDDGRGIQPALSQSELRSLVAGCQADLICVGHTHWPMSVQVNGQQVVNVGSVSNPFPPDLRATYVLLQADTSGYAIQRRRVAFDRQAVIDAVQKVNHPGADYIIRFMRGQHKPPWQTR
jgi:predicted phosphodiesterase